MTRVEELKRHLRPGQVYRREDLAPYSNAVDRHLKTLVNEGALTKLAGGLYHAPKRTVFGKAPANDMSLVETFLKDDRFLMASPNAYNGLGVGTTQLYNTTTVYNHKRHGHFALGGREFDFRVKPSLPRTLTREFLLVDLVNNLDKLGEDQDELLQRVKRQVPQFNRARLKRFARDYGTVRTRKFFAAVLDDADAHAG
jgi:hypothetical protein